VPVSGLKGAVNVPATTCPRGCRLPRGTLTPMIETLAVVVLLGVMLYLDREKV